MEPKGQKLPARSICAYCGHLYPQYYLVLDRDGKRKCQDCIERRARITQTHVFFESFIQRDEESNGDCPPPKTVVDRIAALGLTEEQFRVLAMLAAGHRIKVVASMTKRSHQAIGLMVKRIKRKLAKRGLEIDLDAFLAVDPTEPAPSRRNRRLRPSMVQKFL